MEDSHTPKLIITAICTGLCGLTYYLTSNKLQDQAYGISWGGLAFVGFFALLFLLLAVAFWYSSYVEKRFVLVDADLVSVQSEGLAKTEAGDTIFYWRLIYRWQDQTNGKIIEGKSPIFEGTRVFYNRSKILVKVNPENKEGLKFVDLDFLSNENKNGISLIGEDEVKSAMEMQKVAQQETSNSFIGILLKRLSNFLESNKRWIVLISALAPILLFLAFVALWWFRLRKLT